ncbi:MAG: serine/threonine-protein kinase [Sedimenticola sp.]
MEKRDDLCLGCMKDKGSVEPCPHCGFTIEKDRNPQLLPYNTILNTRFLIGKVLGNPGGFGITYLAWDRSLHTRVAIKEFFPAGISVRNRESTTIRIEGGVSEPDYRDGIRVFLEEARTLARFSHPNIARVRDFFEENNTAYLVMDFYQGSSLSGYLQRQGGTLPEFQVLNIIKPLLAGLKLIHDQGFLHRDIKPSNIQMTPDGTAVLLDFGSARQYICEKTATLSVILTPGYSPVEQYYAKGEQGPWTDVYSVAASLYYLVTAKIPPSAIDRLHDDTLTPPITLNPSLSPAFSHAIIKGMSIKPNQRPQNIDALSLLLDGSNTVSLGHTQYENTKAAHQPLSAPTTRSNSPSRGSSIKVTHVLGGLLLGIVALVAVNLTKETEADRPLNERYAVQTEPPAVEKPPAVTAKPAVIVAPISSLEPAEGVAYVREVIAVDEAVAQSESRPVSPLPPPGWQPQRQQQNAQPPPAQFQPNPINTGTGRSSMRPPQFAIDSCSQKSVGTSCSINDPRGRVNGSCRDLPGLGLVACVPDSHSRGAGGPPARR